jgi:hypothetical protein
MARRRTSMLLSVVVGRAYAQKGSDGGNDSMRDARQGYDIVRGVPCAGLVPCSEQTPCVDGGPKAELGQQLLHWNCDPIAAGRGRRERGVGSGDGRGMGTTTPIAGPGTAFGRRNSRRYQIACRDRSQGRVQKRIVGERLDVGIPCGKRRQDATWPLNWQPLLARDVSTATRQIGLQR